MNVKTLLKNCVKLSALMGNIARAMTLAYECENSGDRIESCCLPLCKMHSKSCTYRVTSIQTLG